MTTTCRTFLSVIPRHTTDEAVSARDSPCLLISVGLVTTNMQDSNTFLVATPSIIKPDVAPRTPLP